MRRRHLSSLTMLVWLAGCAPERAPLLVWEGRGAPRSEATTHAAAALAPAAAGVRRGAWGEADDATYQLLDAERPEEPHVHARHDLTVVLLRGRGRLVVAGRRYDVRAGDVMHIERGKVHAFSPSGRAIGLAIFTPRLSGVDYVPANAVRNADADAP